MPNARDAHWAHESRFLRFEGEVRLSHPSVPPPELFGAGEDDPRRASSGRRRARDRARSAGRRLPTDRGGFAGFEMQVARFSTRGALSSLLFQTAGGVSNFVTGEVSK